MTQEHDIHGEQSEQLPKVKLRGYIGQVSELEDIQTQKGPTVVFKFSVAQHPSKDETIWYRVVTFGERAEAMHERFVSGELHVSQEIDVVGRLREQEYTSRRTGQPGIDRQVFPFEVKPVPPQAPAQ